MYDPAAMVNRRWITYCLIGLAAIVASSAGEAQNADSEAAREKWQRIPELFKALGIVEGSTVADIGAGTGFLTVRLAAAVGPSGRVYAVDIAPDALKTLSARVAKAGLSQVQVVTSTEDDPNLPPSALDAVVMINTYHEIGKPDVVLGHVFKSLKPSGRLALYEPSPKTTGESRADQVSHHVLDPGIIVAELKSAGFEVVTREDGFSANPSGPDAPYPYSLIVARRPRQ